MSAVPSRIDPSEGNDFDRGKREGRVDALLESHTKSILRINGNVERFSKALEQLASDVREGIADLSDGLRTMQEEGRARDLAVKVAADTLADETERRRDEEERLRKERATALEAPVRKWGIRANVVSVVYFSLAFVAIVVGALTAVGRL